MNRKYIYTIIALFSVSLLVFNACKKENTKILSKVESSSKQPEKTTVAQENGILVFRDRQVLNETVSKLNSLNSMQLKNWEKSIGFMSQLGLYNMINESEISLQNRLYSSYDESLSIKNLKDLGVNVHHTDVYNEYKKSHLIFEAVDDDGSVSFELSLKNKALACVLNAEGLVIVNDTICQYIDNYAKFLTDGNREKISALKNATISNDELSIIVLDLDNSKNGYSWTDYSGWEKDGSNKRFCLDVHGYSTTTLNLLHSVYYIEAKGQKKKWDH